MKTMSEQQIKYYKEKFPVGTRVQLDRMGDDPNPIPKGTKGTVSYVDDLSTVFCKFDNGRSMGMCPEVDSFHAIHEQEESFEPTMSM